MRPLSKFAAHVLVLWISACVGSANIPFVETSASAAETGSGVAIESVTLGFNGQFKAGYWTPVHVQLRAGQVPFRGRVDVVVPDADGVPTRFVHSPDAARVSVEAGEQSSIMVIAKLGRWRGEMSIEARGEGDDHHIRTFPLSSFPPPIAAEKEWIVAYGADLQIADALGRKSRAGTNTEVSQIENVAHLPDNWLGWEAVDTCVLTTLDREKIAAMTPGQLAALRTWVSMGGRLVWSLGRNGAELLGSEGRFTQLAPGAFKSGSTLRNFSAVESYSGSPQRIDATADLKAGIPLTVLADPQGVVELSDTISDGTRPLIIRAPLGFGQTVFVAFDLDQPEIAEWDGRARILTRVVQTPAQQSERRGSERSTTQVAQFGYQDMTGQLRSALEQFDGVTVVALWWVAGLVAVYLVVIGPVDYFLLRNVLRRPTLTWLSFPLFVVLFVGLVVWLSPSWKGTRVLLNRVEVVDVDVPTGTFRGTSWGHIYSPRATAWALQSEPTRLLGPSATPVGDVLAWQGLPGTGLSGLSTSAAAPPAIDEYTIELQRTAANGDTDPMPRMQSKIQGVPVHVASTKSLLGCWWGDIDLSAISPLTVDADGLPQGNIVNPLNVELSDCRVYFGSWAFRLDGTRGVLSPGQQTRIERERALNLQWRLTGRRVIDTKDISTPWDQHTLVVPRILEMMMFHGAAGGETYTQLINRYQSYIDLSQHLTMGRAILIGRSEAPATSWTANGQPMEADRQWTFFRVIFPVLTTFRR